MSERLPLYMPLPVIKESYNTNKLCNDQEGTGEGC